MKTYVRLDDPVECSRLAPLGVLRYGPNKTPYNLSIKCEYETMPRGGKAGSFYCQTCILRAILDAERGGHTVTYGD